jgi:hypothetical protein
VLGGFLADVEQTRRAIEVSMVAHFAIRFQDSRCQFERQAGMAFSAGPKRLGTVIIQASRKRSRLPSKSRPGRRWGLRWQTWHARLRYADYLSEKLWKPIGAGDAAVWLDCPGGSARTFGYLFATAEDWARVGQLLLNMGEWGGKLVISRGYLAEMLKPTPSEPTYTDSRSTRGPRARAMWIRGMSHRAEA